MTALSSQADKSRLAYVGRLPGARDSDSWFTPARYLDAARAVLGGTIDLDPYTSPEANRTVGARLIFTEADPAPPGEQWPQVQTAWLNPPYSAALVRTACQQFAAAYHAGRFQAGIVLVNNGTEARYFQHLLTHAAAVCFTDHRLQFENCDGKQISGNTRGQAFFYFGKDVTAFAREFAAFGAVLRCGRALVNGKGR